MKKKISEEEKAKRANKRAERLAENPAEKLDQRKIKNKEKKARQTKKTENVMEKSTRPRTQLRAMAKVQGKNKRLKLKTADELKLIEDKRVLRKQKSELTKIHNQTPPRSEQPKRLTLAAKKKKAKRDKRLGR